MDPAQHDLMREIEDRFWWYRALRAEVVFEVARETARVGRRIRLLDAGCGTGGALQALRREAATRASVTTVTTPATFVGLDLSRHAVTATRARGFEALAQGHTGRLPFPAGSFDVVLSLDVLYHRGVEPRAALLETARVLTAGGALILNLPAFEILRGGHDEAVAGERRFRRGPLGRLLAETGFAVERATYWNLALFPVVLLRRLLTRGRGVDDFAQLPGAVDACLTAWGRGEMAVSRLVPLPAGTSVFMRARKAERKAR